jgi:protein phosphatase
MDRIAVISDVHGNVPAFEAVLADIARRDVRHIVCLGDLVGKGPDGDRTLDMCRETCVATTKGNWDDVIVRNMEHPVALWHRARLGEERLRYLDALPNIIEFWLSGKQVRLFHASQISVHHRVYVYADDALPTHRDMFTNTPFTGDAMTPDIVGYGDLHWAFSLSFEHRMLFNAGSVGNPLDMPLATYTILEGSYQSREPDVWGFQIVRVPYDIERAIRDAAAAAMPDLEAYAKELRTAEYRGKSTTPS